MVFDTPTLQQIKASKVRGRANLNPNPNPNPNPHPNPSPNPHPNPHPNSHPHPHLDLNSNPYPNQVRGRLGSGRSGGLQSRTVPSTPSVAQRGHTKCSLGNARARLLCLRRARLAAPHSQG